MLLLDHVPRNNAGGYASVFDSDVLQPIIDQNNGLLIAAMQHWEDWGLIRSHPRPLILRGLTNRGIARIIRENGWGEAAFYFKYVDRTEEHHPLLAKFICTSQENLQDGIKGFLQYWTEQQQQLSTRQLAEEARQMTRLFNALGLLEADIWDDFERLKTDIQRFQISVNARAVQRTLQNLRWIEYQADAQSGKMKLVWVAPIRQALQIQMRLVQTAL